MYSCRPCLSFLYLYIYVCFSLVSCDQIVFSFLPLHLFLCVCDVIRFLSIFVFSFVDHLNKVRFKHLNHSFIPSPTLTPNIWNITEENSFIDAGIIYRPDVGFCLVIKQGFNIMIGKHDDEKIPIHCPYGS